MGVILKEEAMANHAIVDPKQFRTNESSQEC